MLVILPLKEVAGAIWAIIATVFLSRRASEDGPPWITLTIVAVLIVIGVARWFTTTYRVTEHRFEVRTGVLKRTTTHAVRGAIRAIDTESPLLYRALGITKVRVSTGTAEPVELNAVTNDDAAALQRILGTSVAPTVPVTTTHPPLAAGSEAEVPTTPPTTIPIIHFTTAWLRAVPFSGAGLAAAAGVMAAGLQLIHRYFSNDEVGDAMVQGATWVENFGVTAFIVLAVLASMVIILVTSLVLYLVRFGSYRLWAEPHHTGVNLRGTRGLLTTSNTSTDYARIYGVKIKDGYVARLGAVREATLLIGGRSASSGSEGKESAHLMPLAPTAEVVRATVATLSLGSLPGVAQIYDHAPRRRHRNPTPLNVTSQAVHDACTRPLVSHGPRARRRIHVRSLIRSSIPLLTLIVLQLTGWLHGVPKPIWVVAGLLLMVSPLWAEDRYRYLGHHVTPDLLISQCVGYNRKRTILATRAIIGWGQHATYFQRRASLVTLLAATSTGTEPLAIHDVPLDMVPYIITVATPTLAVPPPH